jgi:ribosome maturation factor RimP
MIEIQHLKEFVSRKLEETPYFVVDVAIDNRNFINVEIDSFDPVDVDFCASLSRAISDEFGDALDEYDMEVGSAGLTAPFKVRKQYEKNVGNPVEVLTTDGKKLKGNLAAVGDDSFTLEIEEKVKKEGSKKPVIETKPLEINLDNVKYTKYLLQF